MKYNLYLKHQFCRSVLQCLKYRQISLLSNIKKALEKLMCNRLYSFLEKRGLICSLQFGFGQKHSTTHALIHLTDKIRNEIANYVSGIFLDFLKTFDTVDYYMLLK